VFRKIALPAAFLLVAVAAASLSLASSGCAPQPAATPTATSAPSPTPTPGASASASEEQQPFKAISRGTGNQPARYTVRNAAGRIVYDVRSTTVVYDRASDGTAVATFAKPDVTFHAKNGLTMLARAPEAVAHDKDKSVTMTGGVHAKTDDGKVLTCDTLTYDAKHEQIRGAGNVVLTNTKSNQVASGQTLVSDAGFEHVTLSGSP